MTTGQARFGAMMSIFDAPVCSSFTAPLVATQERPTARENLHFACEILTGSFGAVSPPGR